jgi:hypothetical protein
MYSAEFIDPVFAKTSSKRSFLVIENERFRLVFAKTGSTNLGTGREKTSEKKRHQIFKLPNFCGNQLISTYTVTSLDVIFRYPDRVPLTHFVHRAKRVFYMWA